MRAECKKCGALIMDVLKGTSGPQSVFRCHECGAEAQEKHKTRGGHHRRWRNPQSGRYP